MDRAVKGIIGEKLGMTQVWNDQNQIVPVTVIQAGPCVVTQVRTEATDGYSAVQLAYGAIDPRKVNKPDAGHFKKAGVTPRKHVAEIRTTDAVDYTIGQELGPDVFDAGQLVDVTATSRGKGFAGAMKRHGFHGLRASHGVQRKHRSTGSVGAGTTPGRTYRGQKMPGRMGGERVTTQNLTVHMIDPEKNLLFIKGAVPGPVGSMVVVRSSSKGAR
jgi:large subunit ribosomal protein L3